MNMAINGDVIIKNFTKNFKIKFFNCSVSFKIVWCAMETLFLTQILPQEEYDKKYRLWRSMIKIIMQKDRN